MKNSKVSKRLIILIGTIITQLGLGTFYSWSLFNQPLVNKFGWGLNKVSLTFSIASFALSFSTLFSGKLQEKFGIKRVVGCCGIVLGTGLILTAKVHSLISLYIFAGVMLGAADGIAYMISLSNCIKWFPEKKGLISGISVGAYGTGSLIFKYIDSAFLRSSGVSIAFEYWGILAMILIFVGGMLLKDAPLDPIVNSDSKDKVDNNFTVKEMLRTKQAYLLFIAFFSACMGGLYLIGIVKDIGVNLVHLDVQAAANSVAMVAIFNTVGRIILGGLSDKIGALRVIGFNFIVTAISVTVLLFVPLNFEIFFACVAGIAFCFGGNITIFPSLVGDFFGLKNHSKNYGVIYQGFGIGALSGSVIANIVGGFRPTFMVIGVLCIISLIIVATIKAPHHERVINEELKLGNA
ncbi:L-lactate MFS transporter [Clostridium sp.]|uniref:L-lactate MFS transporter n=1 Tax=Clostridium sp. TaxID=1506 RepID=UPI002FC9AEED